MRNRKRVEAFLRFLPEDFAGLRDRVSRFIGSGENLVDASGILSVHRVHVAGHPPFLFRFFPPVQNRQLDQEHHRFIPRAYQQILHSMNGCYALGVSLFGVCQRTAPGDAAPREIDAEPLDLALANETWIRGYTLPNRPVFHFGGRGFSGKDRAGYFMDRAGQILCIRPSGDRVGTWRNFRHFLEDEMAAAESFWRCRIAESLAR